MQPACPVKCALPSSTKAQGISAPTSESNAQFSTQAPPTEKDPVPFKSFDDGVSYKEYKAGAGEAVVAPGKTVSAQVVLPLPDNSAVAVAALFPAFLRHHAQMYPYSYRLTSCPTPTWDSCPCMRDRCCTVRDHPRPTWPSLRSIPMISSSTALTDCWQAAKPQRDQVLQHQGVQGRIRRRTGPPMGCWHWAGAPWP